MTEGHWSDGENDALVAAYFSMLTAELAGEPFSKAAANRALQARIGRSHGAIEYKHRNVSTVLMGLAEPWIIGYRPAVNNQRSLEDAVIRWLDANSEWRAVARPAGGAFADASALWVGPPPTMSNAPEPAETAQAMAIARRHDTAARDERNRALGRAGERLVLEHERTGLTRAGRGDLAERVRWTSDLDGDGAGYDIQSFGPDGRARLIEVKTTNGWERTPFHVSANELAVADERRADWCLFRLWDFARDPKAFELYPPLDAHVALTPTSFRASFR